MTNTNGSRKSINALSDLTPDTKNANKGTQRGRGLLEKSLRQHGAGRSVLVDRDGEIIAGNKTVEIAAEIDLPIKVVQTNGEELVVVQRTDLKLESKDGRGLALADNRIAEIDLEWDTDNLQFLADTGVELGEWWNHIEIDRMFDSSLLELEQGGAEAADIGDYVIPKGTASHVKMVQLFFDVETFNQFNEMMNQLARKYETDNLTDTVWEAIKDVSATG